MQANDGGLAVCTDHHIYFQFTLDMMKGSKINNIQEMISFANFKNISLTMVNLLIYFIFQLGNHTCSINFMKNKEC